MSSQCVIAVEKELRLHGEGALASLGRVVPIEDVHATAAIVRSTTRVDRPFLEARPRLRYVASASSGQDHVDVEALASAGIAFTAARGCNADAVADWVELALAELEIHPACLGVVGVGHAGSAVAGRFPGRVMLCDPPRAAMEATFPHRDLEDLLALCDVLTLHVPLQVDTLGMIGADTLERFGGKAILNAARGPVLDPMAAKGYAARGGLLALDVFPNEPAVDPELVQAAAYATPHLAGHTDAAKSKALQMCIDWLAERLGLKGQGRVAYPEIDGDPALILRRAQAALRAGADFYEVRPKNIRPALSSRRK